MKENILEQAIKRDITRARLLWVGHNGPIKSLRDFLSQRCFVVDHAANMRKALEMMEGNTYDFVLLDLRRFDRNRLSSLSQLARGSAPVVAVNGEPSIPCVVKAIRAGALDYLPEPLVAEQLLEIILKPSAQDLISFNRNDPVVDHIYTHAPAIKTREEVALRFGISPNTVSSRVRSVTSTTFTDFLHTCRLQGACRLLETTSLNISQISARVGFSTPEHFSRIFRRHVGLSPGSYRLKRRARDLVHQG